MADGRIYLEAVFNAKVTIAEWIEMAEELGRPIPNPRERGNALWKPKNSFTIWKKTCSSVGWKSIRTTGTKANHGRDRRESIRHIQRSGERAYFVCS
jgi:hypothetical protein